MSAATDAIVAAFRDNGLSDDLMWLPLGISYGESGWRPDAVGDSGASVGLFQLHEAGMGAGMGDSRYDPYTNAARMAPTMINAIYNAVGQGYQGVDLFKKVWLDAERPLDTPQARARMENVYNEVIPMVQDIGGFLGGIFGRAGGGNSGGATYGGLTPGLDDDLFKTVTGTDVLGNPIYGAPDPAAFQAYYYNMGKMLGGGGQAVPKNLPAEARASFNAGYSVGQSDKTSGGIDPTTAAHNTALTSQIYQAIDQNAQLFPEQLAQLRQEIQQSNDLFPLEVLKRGADIEYTKAQTAALAPYGDEAILRSANGQAGYQDYLSGKVTPDESLRQDAQYSAGWNMARILNEGTKYQQTQLDETRRANTASMMGDYLDFVTDQITADIQNRDLKTSQIVAEYQKHLSAFQEAGQQFEGLMKYSVPITDSGHVYGFEPGGFASSLGLAPITQQQTYQYNPFAAATHLVQSTPSPLEAGVASLPGYGGQGQFAAALDFYNQQRQVA